MKRILSVFVSIVFVLTGTVLFAAQANVTNYQTSPRPSAMTSLYSGASGTQVTTNYAVFDYPMNSVACDIVSYTSASTATGSFVLYSSATGTNAFDKTNALIPSVTITPSASAAVVTRVSTTYRGPFRAIQGVLTTNTTNSLISATVNCAATQ